MTIHIQMLYEVAKHAKAMADAMQAIVDDCAEQIARRKAAGETDEAMLGEVFGSTQPDTSADMTPYAGATPFDEKSAEDTPFDEKSAEEAISAAPEKPKLTLVELRAFVAERSTPENRPKIKAILGQFGVKKLTELREDQYRAVMSEVRKACQK